MMNLLFILLEKLSNLLYIIYTNLIYIVLSNVCFITNNEYNYVLISYNSKINKVTMYSQDILCDIGWKYCQIVTLSNECYNKQILPLFHLITDDYFKNPFLLIKNSEEIKYFKNKESLYLIDSGDFDLLFYTNYSNNDSKKNYTMISHSIDLNKYNLSNIIKSNINFMVFELTFNTVKYDINLKEPYNFLIRENILDHVFFKWYMNKHYKIHLTNNYKIYYMLQDISSSELTSPFFIKFNNNKIISCSDYNKICNDEVDNTVSVSMIIEEK